MADNSAEYEIRLKDLFSKPLEAIEKKMNGFELKVNSIGASIGNVFGGALLASAAWKAVGAIEAVGQSVVELGSKMEVTRVTMKALFGGNADFANNMISQFQRFAQTSPFNTQEVLQGAKLLRAYGFEAKSLIPTMSKLGDVTSALDLNFNDMVWLYGHTKTLGHADRRVLREFTTRGIDLIPALAKIKGVTSEAIEGKGGLATKGKISFGDISKALDMMTSKGGIFFNIMEQKSKTVSGQWERLKDTFEIIGTRMGEQTLPLLAQSLGNVTDLVNTMAFINMAPLNASFDTMRKTLLQISEIGGPKRESEDGTWGPHGIWEQMNQLNRIDDYVLQMAILGFDKLNSYNFGLGTGPGGKAKYKTMSYADLKKQQDDAEVGYNTDNQMNKNKLAFDEWDWKFGRKSGKNADFYQQLDDKNMTLRYGSDRSKWPGAGTGGQGDAEGDGYGAGSGVEKIQAGSRNITLNIGKLIETVNFTKSYQQSEEELKDMLTRALLSEVNNVNIAAD